jgi:hypothetical protein
MMRYDRSISVVHSPENNCYFYQEEDPDEQNHSNFRLPNNDYHFDPSDNDEEEEDEEEEDIDTVIIDTKRYPKPYVYVAGLRHSIPIDCELWKSMARGRCCHGGDVNYERAIHKIFREENRKFRDDGSWAAASMRSGYYSKNNANNNHKSGTTRKNATQRSIHSRSTYYNEKYEDRRRKLGQHESEEDDDSNAVRNSKQQQQQSPHRGLEKPQMIARSQQKQRRLHPQNHRPSHVSVGSNDAVTPEISYPEEWTVCSNSIRTSPDMPSSAASAAATTTQYSNHPSFQIPQAPKNTSSSKMESYREQALEQRQQIHEQSQQQQHLSSSSSSSRRNLIMSKKPWTTRNERIPTPPTTTSRDQEEEDDDDDNEQLSPNRARNHSIHPKRNQRRRLRRRSRPSRNGLYSVLKKLARHIFRSR